MPGKMRPSLRSKVLNNVVNSKLSITDKECIGGIFKKFEELTAADVVEVVRCIKCKHFAFSDMYGECNRRFEIVQPYDFCSYGERKEE